MKSKSLVDEPTKKAVLKSNPPTQSGGNGGGIRKK